MRTSGIITCYLSAHSQGMHTSSNISVQFQNSSENSVLIRTTKVRSYSVKYEIMHCPQCIADFSDVQHASCNSDIPLLSHYIFKGTALLPDDLHSFLYYTSFHMKLCHSFTAQNNLHMGLCEI